MSDPVKSLVTRIKIIIDSVLTALKDEGTTVEVSATDPCQITRTMSLDTGVLDDLADVLYHELRPVAAEADETVDLTGGDLTDAFGEALTLVKVKAVYIRNNDELLGITIGGATALPILADAEKLNLPPLGSVLLQCPLTTLNTWAVAAGTSDILTISKLAGTASTASPNVDIVIIGTNT